MAPIAAQITSQVMVKKLGLMKHGSNSNLGGRLYVVCKCCVQTSTFLVSRRCLARLMSLDHIFLPVGPCQKTTTLNRWPWFNLGHRITLRAALGHAIEDGPSANGFTGRKTAIVELPDYGTVCSSYLSRYPIVEIAVSTYEFFSGCVELEMCLVTASNI